MDGRSDTSRHPSGPAASLALDDFDPLAFDALPIWHRSAARPQPPLILVVDDEPDVGRVIQRLLCERLPQHDIVVATDPADALQQSTGRTVALLITDMVMPDINGIQLAAKVRVRTPDTPVLLITAYPSPLLDRLVQLRGIQSYLPKPFALSDLERLAVAALGVGEAPVPQPQRRS
jgi:CheY-like chemotaxis protein